MNWAKEKALDPGRNSVGCGSGISLLSFVEHIYTSDENQRIGWCWCLPISSCFGNCYPLIGRKFSCLDWLRPITHYNNKHSGGICFHAGYFILCYRNSCSCNWLLKRRGWLWANWFIQWFNGRQKYLKEKVKVPTLASCKIFFCRLERWLNG